MKPICSFAARGDPDSRDRDVARLVRGQGEAEDPGVDEHEAVAAVGGVHGERPEPFDLQDGIETVDEGGDVPHPHPFDPFLRGTTRLLR